MEEYLVEYNGTNPQDFLDEMQEELERRIEAAESINKTKPYKHIYKYMKNRQMCQIVCLFLKGRTMSFNL